VKELAVENVFSRLFSQMMERPRWQQWALLIAGGLGLFGLLYLAMLKTALQQLEQGQQEADTLQQNVINQQRRLLLQPSLNDLLRERALLITDKTTRMPLVDKIAGPLRQSAGTLLQWQPEARAIEPVSGNQHEERGSLTLIADFKGLLVLLRGLLNEPSAPVLGQLQLHTEKPLLHITLSLAAEPLRSSAFTPAPVVEGINRDPFSARDLEVCSENSNVFMNVILGGVIGDGLHQQGWMLWPGRGWQPVKAGWRDDSSGWQVAAVENRLVMFNLLRPPCAEKQHMLALAR